MFSRWWAKLRRLFASRKPLAAPVPPPPPPPPPPTSSILANTAIPVITGAAIVGQTLFCSTGTWSGSPASFSFAWFNDDGAIEGVGDTYTVQDAQVGKSIRCEVTAVNGLGVSAPVSSVATSAVADVNLASAITAFSRTSSSGTVPMTWSLSFGSNVYEGYFLRAKVFSNQGLTVLVQNVQHLLTAADMVAGATIDLAPDGLTAPTATQWLQLGIETTSPNGIFHSYTHATALSPTDPAPAIYTDNFNDNSFNTTGMTATGGAALYKPSLPTGSVTVAETSNELEITVAAAGQRYDGPILATAEDFTGGSRFITWGHSSTQGTEEFGFSIGDTSNNVSFVSSGNTLIAGKMTSGTYANDTVGGTWSPTTHKHWRFKDSGSNILLQTAPNTASNPPVDADFTTMFTVAKPAGFTTSSVKLSWWAGQYSTATPNTTVKALSYNTSL